jgi:hypothetical protein
MKNHIIKLTLFVTLLFGVSACKLPATIPTVPSDALARVMPCLVELLGTQDVEKAKECFLVAGAGIARDVLITELKAYLTSTDDALLKTLYEILFGKQPIGEENFDTVASYQDSLEAVSEELASWLPEPLTLEGALYR